MAAYDPEDPPGLSRLPQQWGLCSRCVCYSDSNYVNYPRPQGAADARERFVVCRADGRGTLEAVGYRTYLRLADRHRLMGQAPGR